MHWSWFSFVIGLLVAVLVPAGVKKLNQLIDKA